MPDRVQLIGLDFGTTTSSAVVAEASLARSAVTGRVDLADFRTLHRSPMAFTPLDGDRLDLAALGRTLDAWLADGGVSPEDLFGGGALLTGLTARRDNAAGLVALVRGRVGRALVATADDPCLESWLAFHGACGPLCRAAPDTPFLNLDVGGGTTNLALGLAGEVRRTGCLFVGARHVRVEPGTYRVVSLSPFARDLFAALDVRGDTLSARDVSAVVGWYVRLLEAAVRGDRAAFLDPVAAGHVQVPYRPPDDVPPAVTFSGGVGELVYAHLAGEPWPGTTAFGDLGIDLAQAIVRSPLWASSLAKYRPASAGRATVYGLLRHSKEVSGSSLYLPRPDVLPLDDVPVLGGVDPATPDAEIDALLSLAARSGRAALRVRVGGTDAAAVRAMGRRLAEALERVAFPVGVPLALLVREDAGKALGHYATRWGRLPASLVVLDEVSQRDAQYAQIGPARGGVVPVSLFGLTPDVGG